MRALAGIGGALVIVLVTMDAFSTIVLTRRTRHSFRITRAFYVLTWTPYAAIARRIRSGRAREHMLGIYGPLSLLLIFALWAIGSIVGFGLLEWAIRMRPEQDSGTLLNDLYYSGLTFFTLDSARPQDTISRIITVMEGGFGFAFLSLIIGYLPVFYQASSEREREISQLDGRSGSPPSAGDILRMGISSAATLERFLALWERWAAELLEAQISFPPLAWYRSQHANKSWLTALVLTIDCAAVFSLCAEEDLKTQAEFTFAMGRHALADTSAIFGMRPGAAKEDRLTHENFLKLRQCIIDATAPLSAGRLEEEDLKQLRGMYEPEAEALSRYFLMALPSWLPTESSRENWRARRPGREVPLVVSDPFRESDL